MVMYSKLRDIGRDGFPSGKSAPGQAGWISSHLLKLRQQLFEEIGKDRNPRGLIIGTWNIKHFDGGSPRLEESFYYIAEIISNFDICTIQEAKSVEAVKSLTRLLGPNWDFFVNDSAGGGRGNHERVAFVYNTERVFFRSLIGELVLPDSDEIGGRQFARSPFFAAFQAGWFKFTLYSVHIVQKDKEGQPSRLDEIESVAETLIGRAEREDGVQILLGDLNIDKADDPEHKALTDRGFVVPDVGPTNLPLTKVFDHIALTGPEDMTQFVRAKSFDWRGSVFRNDQAEIYRAIASEMALANNRAAPGDDWEHKFSGWTTNEMSDHLPVWIEILTDFSDDYLRRTTELATELAG